MSETCPKCGAHSRPGLATHNYECGTFMGNGPEFIDESRECLRRQLTTVTAERDALLAREDAVARLTEELIEHPVMVALVALERATLNDAREGGEG